MVRSPPFSMPEDCLSCRVIGTGTLGGTSIYLLHQRSFVTSSGHRGLLLAGSAVFFGLSVFRWTLE